MYQNLERHLSGSLYRVKDLQKVRIFDAIRSSNVLTRKQLAQSLSIRPSTVSDLVQELLDSELVMEGPPSSNGRQGRPQITLHANDNKLIALALFFVSMDLKAALINAAGELFQEETVALSGETGHEQFIESARHIVRNLLGQAPRKSELIGCGISFPGYVNLETQTWVFAARWPFMKNFRVAYLQPDIPVKIQAKQALDAELEHLMEIRPHYRIGGTAMVHWGYGIGSSYAYNGEVILPKAGSFGEIGHVAMSEKSQSELCVCGRRGCIETRAALWAILPKLLDEYPGLPVSETDFGYQIKEKKLDQHPVITDALEAFTDALVLLYTILSPDRIVLHGPFVDHTPIFSRLQELLKSKIPEMFDSLLSVEYVRQELVSDSIGSTASFFMESYKELLTAN